MPKDTKGEKRGGEGEKKKRGQIHLEINKKGKPVTRKKDKIISPGLRQSVSVMHA